MIYGKFTRTVGNANIWLFSYGAPKFTFQVYFRNCYSNYVPTRDKTHKTTRLVKTLFFRTTFTKKKKSHNFFTSKNLTETEAL